jgi:hypothetical protein
MSGTEQVDAYRFACLAAASAETLRYRVAAPPAPGWEPAIPDGAAEELADIIADTLGFLAMTLSAPAVREDIPDAQERLTQASRHLVNASRLASPGLQVGRTRAPTAGDAVQAAWLARQSAEALHNLVTGTAVDGSPPAGWSRLGAEELHGIIADTLGNLGLTLSARTMREALPGADARLTCASRHVADAVRKVRNPSAGAGAALPARTRAERGQGRDESATAPAPGEPGRPLDQARRLIVQAGVACTRLAAIAPDGPAAARQASEIIALLSQVRDLAAAGWRSAPEVIQVPPSAEMTAHQAQIDARMAALGFDHGHLQEPASQTGAAQARHAAARTATRREQEAAAGFHRGDLVEYNGERWTVAARADVPLCRTAPGGLPLADTSTAPAGQVQLVTLSVDRALGKGADIDHIHQQDRARNPAASAPPPVLPEPPTARPPRTDAGSPGTRTGKAQGDLAEGPGRAPSTVSADPAAANWPADVKPDPDAAGQATTPGTRSATEQRVQRPMKGR